MRDRSAITEEPNDRTYVEWCRLKLVCRGPLSASVVHSVGVFVRLSLSLAPPANRPRPTNR